MFTNKYLYVCSVLIFSLSLFSISCGKMESTESNLEEPIKEEVKLIKPEEIREAGGIRLAEVEMKKTGSSMPETGEKNKMVLLVDNFNDGQKPNSLGGDFGSWNKDEKDSTQGCVDSFDAIIKHGEDGYSLRLDCDVDSPSPAYNGFWSKLENVDLKNYNQLTFWVRGDEILGYTTKFKVELKNNKGEVGKYLVTRITDSWQKITIPLNELKEITDRSSMKEFVIVFDDVTATNKKGTIYIDDIYFEQ